MATNPPRDPISRARARERHKRQIRRRRVVLLGCLAALIVLILGLSIGLTQGNDETNTRRQAGTAGTATVGAKSTQGSTTTLALSSYSAQLTGAAAIPPVQTSVTVAVSLRYTPGTGKMTYTVNVLSDMAGARNVTIYNASATTKGTPVYVLYTGPKTGSFKGQLANGTIDPAKFTGALAGKTVADFISMVSKGEAYVAMGSTSHPAEALRGKLKLATG